MAISEDAHRTGREVAAAARQAVAERLASMLKRDPDLAATAIEVGLVDREWMEEPGQHPVSSAGTKDVLQRFIERSAEHHPSTLSRFGLSALQAMSWTAEEPGEGNGARLTMVFTDLEGFTRYTTRQGDDAAAELLSEHHRTISPIVRGRGGKVVKRLGDGLMLSFAEPAAAIYAALELVASPPAGLRLRAGVHTGDVVLAGNDVIGHTVNVAARVAEVAKGGQVLASAASVAEAGPLRKVTVLRAKRRSFKGVDGTTLVHRVEND